MLRLVGSIMQNVSERRDVSEIAFRVAQDREGIRDRATRTQFRWKTPIFCPHPLPPPAALFSDRGGRREATRWRGIPRAGDLKYGHVDAKNIGARDTYDLYGVSPVRRDVRPGYGMYARVLDVRARHRDNDKIINCGPLPRWPHNPSAGNRIEFLSVRNRACSPSRSALRAETRILRLQDWNIARIHCRWLRILNGYGETLFMRGNVSCIGYHAGKTRGDSAGIVRLACGGVAQRYIKLVIEKYYRLANVTMKLQRLIIFTATFNNINSLQCFQIFISTTAALLLNCLSI